jgi:hypothetical protein
VPLTDYSRTGQRAGPHTPTPAAAPAPSSSSPSALSSFSASRPPLQADRWLLYSSYAVRPCAPHASNQGSRLPAQGATPKHPGPEYVWRKVWRKVWRQVMTWRKVSHHASKNVYETSDLFEVMSVHQQQQDTTNDFWGWSPRPAVTTLREPHVTKMKKIPPTKQRDPCTTIPLGQHSRGGPLPQGLGLKQHVKTHTMQYSLQYRRQQGQARIDLQVFCTCRCKCSRLKPSAIGPSLSKACGCSCSRRQEGKKAADRRRQDAPLSPRLAGHVRALGRMPIVRGVSHAQMTLSQVRLEGLVGNPSVADANGS